MGNTTPYGNGCHYFLFGGFSGGFWVSRVCWVLRVFWIFLGDLPDDSLPLFGVEYLFCGFVDLLDRVFLLTIILHTINSELTIPSFATLYTKPLGFAEIIQSSTKNQTASAGRY